MHFPVQCSSVQRKEDNLFLFLSFFFLLLWLPSSFSVTISPGREENLARRELTWKASRLGLKSLPWSQRFSIPKLFGILSHSSSNCSQILLSGLSAEAEWEWNEGSEGHGRQSKQCYEKVTIPARIFLLCQVFGDEECPRPWEALNVGTKMTDGIFCTLCESKK